MTETYLYLIEDQSIPQAVVPHDSTAQFCLFPPHGVMEDDSSQRGRNRAQNLHTYDIHHFKVSDYSPFVSKKLTLMRRTHFIIDAVE